MLINSVNGGTQSRANESRNSVGGTFSWSGQSRAIIESDLKLFSFQWVVGSYLKKGKSTMKRNVLSVQVETPVVFHSLPRFCTFVCLFIYVFIYLFCGERRRKREGERNIDVWEKHRSIGCLSHSPARDLAHNPGMCPDWKSNPWPFGCGTTPHPLSRTSQGSVRLFNPSKNIRNTRDAFSSSLVAYSVLFLLFF